MPFVENSEQITRDRVEHQDFKGTALELMNRIELLSNGSGRDELSWLCKSIKEKYGKKQISYSPLPEILATKAMEKDDGELLAIAADIAQMLYVPFG